MFGLGKPGLLSSEIVENVHTNFALTKSERESLKAIYRLGHNGREAHTGALAETL